MKLNNVQVTPLEELKANSLIMVNEVYVNENEEICSNKKVIDVYDIIKCINDLASQNKKLTDIVVKLSQHINKSVESNDINNINNRLCNIEQILEDNLLIN